MTLLVGFTISPVLKSIIAAGGYNDMTVYQILNTFCDTFEEQVRGAGLAPDVWLVLLEESASDYQKRQIGAESCHLCQRLRRLVESSARKETYLYSFSTQKISPSCV